MPGPASIGVTLSARELAAALEARGLAPDKALGQHFVVDPNTVRRIARMADLRPGDRVVEVGAGPGSLTLALAETGARVTAVEIDRSLVEILREQVAGLDVEVVRADAMSLDWDALLGEPDGGWSLVANLPYNVGTPLLADLLDREPAIRRFLVMVQLEVARRLVAPAGDRHRGALSVKVEHHGRARIVGRVPRTVFLPPPDVESALVEIVRRDDSPVRGDDEGRLFELLTAAFGQRRKMLRRSLAGRVDETAFERAGVAPTERPERLTLDQWAALVVAARGDASPASSEPER